MHEELTVKIFLDFREDGRHSMEVFGEELVGALRGASPSGVRIESFRPQYPFGRLGCGAWRNRFARYISYPFQTLGKQGSINHIIDHGYAHLALALNASRTVITVHDLIPIIANRGKIPGIRRHKAWLSELSARCLQKARLLISDSSNTKEDLRVFCGVPESRILVIPPGLSSKFRQLNVGDKGELRRRLGMPGDGAFLILITGKQFYKNHATSLRVLRDLRRNGLRDARVVWLGNKRAKSDVSVVELGLQDMVIGVIPEDSETLVQIYNAVDCLLFPSWYEGFGWPPLEAMACGTPVVCSNAASLPEVVGDAALVAKPTDREQLVQHVLGIAQDDRSRVAFIKKGLVRASQFSWEKHAKAVWQVYMTMLS